MTVSWSDHCRIMLGSCSDHSRIGRAFYMTFQLFSTNYGQIWDSYFFVAGAVFGEVGGSYWQLLMSPHIVNNVASVTKINHERHFWWN